MNFTRIKDRVKSAVIFLGYSRTAQELNLLSDAQLADLGISRELLKMGATAYPWRIEETSKITPASVTNLKTLTTETYSEDQRPHTPKAA